MPQNESRKTVIAHCSCEFFGKEGHWSIVPVTFTGDISTDENTIRLVRNMIEQELKSLYCYFPDVNILGILDKLPSGTIKEYKKYCLAQLTHNHQ